MTKSQLSPQNSQQQRHSKVLYRYTCINCGHAVPALHKNYSNGSVKAIHCEACCGVADKYIEFEPVIILVDAMLLSQESYRHMLYNRNFKLHWKLSLVLLLLESFALWRKKRESSIPLEYNRHEMISEKGFYLCCLQNIIDYLILTILLMAITFVHRGSLLKRTGYSTFIVTLLKAVTIANFSKFFLLPIMVWRENTTDFGADIHNSLVLGHHLFSLIFIYSVVGYLTKLQAALIVLPAYFLKEYVKKNVSLQLERNF